MAEERQAGVIGQARPERDGYAHRLSQPWSLNDCPCDNPGDGGRRFRSTQSGEGPQGCQLLGNRVLQPEPSEATAESFKGGYGRAKTAASSFAGKGVAIPKRRVWDSCNQFRIIERIGSQSGMIVGRMRWGRSRPCSIKQIKLAPQVIHGNLMQNCCTAGRPGPRGGPTDRCRLDLRDRREFCSINHRSRYSRR
jgi:hypothetical protein